MFEYNKQNRRNSLLFKNFDHIDDQHHLNLNGSKYKLNLLNNQLDKTGYKISSRRRKSKEIDWVSKVNEVHDFGYIATLTELFEMFE